MRNDATDPDDLPNGSGHGDTSSNAEDTSSGGTPDQPRSAPKPPEEGDVQQPSSPPKSALEDADGTPKENPAG
jgi:hypothetical protein